MKESFSGSKITLQNIQVKSIKKARRLAKALSILEIECGIQSVEFELRNSFICPDVKIWKLGKTPMERTLRKLIKSYRNTK